MSDCKPSNCCDSNKGACDSGKQESDIDCPVAQELLCLAKEAKKELLKEKMKAIFEVKKGKKLDKIAEVAVEAVIACFEHQMAGKEACGEYQQNLKAAFKS